MAASNSGTHPQHGGDGDRPVIGISTYIEPSSWGPWRDVNAALIPHHYVEKVERAGGVAVLVPPRLDADERWAGSVLRRLDGLVLAGGVDIDPERYGQSRHASVQASRADRDAAELALARASAELDLPVLGICRGMQVMAVAAGGSVEQHVPDRVGHHGHAPAPGTYGQHRVAVEAGSLLASVVGAEVSVPSYHHQSVADHPGYLGCAWDPDDGTLEGMEDRTARFRLAVQWHPEVSSDLRLFAALVSAASR